MELILVFAAGFFFLTFLLYFNGMNKSSQFIQPSTINQQNFNSKSFLLKLFFLSWLLRLILVVFINATGAIQRLGLSSDSLRYGRMGEIIAAQMEQGNFNWPNWIDNGWFQFNGLVYYLFGSHSIIIQLFNITIACIVPLIVYQSILMVFRDIRIAKLTAIMVAIFPSFIYWSTLMLKDPISWLAVALLVYGTVGVKIQFKVKYILSIFIGLIIFIGVREYMFYISMMIIALAMYPLRGSTPGQVFRWLAIVLILGFSAQLAGFGFFAIDRISESIYFDIDYLNYARVKLSDHGSGRFFQNEADAVWGQGLLKDLKSFTLAVYYSLLSLDLSNIGSVRQLMALPEVLLFMYLFPNLVVGAKVIWYKHRNLALPLLGFGFGILVVYGSTTTNKGALFRWRMQALPYILAIVSYGIYYRQKGWFYRLLVKYKI